MVTVRRGTVRLGQLWMFTVMMLAALPGCTQKPVASAFLLAPGIPQGASTFSIAPATDAASQAAVPYIQQRLVSFGYQPSATPDLLVIVSAAEHGRNVGAFAPGGCHATNWVEQPGRKWLLGGGRSASLQLHMVDAKSGKPVYQSSASLRLGVA